MMTTQQNSNSVPTSLLYIGAAGEHHVISECFRHNMEAFKLPIDKGFDLVVTRAYTHLARLENTSTPPQQVPSEMPMYLQVKSRQASLTSTGDTENDRPSWEGCFPIKPMDLDLICATPNAALVCVLFFETRDQLIRSRTAYAWWMSSKHVQRLRDSKHFIVTPDKDRLELWVRYKEPAAESSYKQHTHISLRRQDARRTAKPGDRATGELLSEAVFDFGRLGTDIAS